MAIQFIVHDWMGEAYVFDGSDVERSSLSDMRE